MKHGNQTKGIAAGTRAPAQDLQRHTARAAAQHLSPAEITKRDAACVEEDVAALDRMIAPGSPLRPLRPPGRRL